MNNSYSLDKTIMSQNYARPMVTKPRFMIGNTAINLNPFNSRPVNKRKREKHCLRGNDNVLVIGSDCDATNSVILPNILQMNSSFVITTSGGMLENLHNVLVANQYDVKVLDLCHAAHSNYYNPLRYVRDTADVDLLIECLFSNTDREECIADKQSFIAAEKLLYSACILYLKDFEKDVTKKNLVTILSMLDKFNFDENNANAKSGLDNFFDAIPQDSLAAARYNYFKQTAGNALEAVVTSCIARLHPLGESPIKDLISHWDELNLSEFDERKMALFIVSPFDREESKRLLYNSFVTMIYEQLRSSLYSKCEQYRECNQPYFQFPIKFFLCEGFNCGIIPDFPMHLATMHLFNLSAIIVAQTISQIEWAYKDQYRALIGNCSSLICFETYDLDTCGFVKRLFDSSKETYGNLLNRDLFSCLDNNCIVKTPQLIRLDQKYDYRAHPCFQQTGFADRANEFSRTQLAEKIRLRRRPPTL